MSYLRSMTSLKVKILIALNLFLNGTAAFAFHNVEMHGQASGCQHDQHISEEVRTALMNDAKISGYKINVSTRQKIVYLSGEVSGRESMIRANELARSIKGVRGVVNMLKMGPG